MELRNSSILWEVVELQDLKAFNSYIISSTIILAVSFISLIILHAYFNKLGKVISSKKIKRKLDTDDKSGLSGLEILPGPRSWDPTGIIGNGLELLPFEKILENSLKWSVKYGDIFKATGLNQIWVVLNSGPTVQSLLKSSDMGHQTKCETISGLSKPFMSNGAFFSNGSLWQHQRKILLKSQSYSNLKACMPMLNQHCKTFVSSLESMFQDGKPHQINELINSSFIKIICEMITGSDSDQSEEFSGYHHKLQSWLDCVFYRILHPWLLVGPLWKLHPLSRKHDRFVEQLSEFARRRIREHRQNRLNPDTESHSSDNDKGFRSVLDDLVDEGVDEGQIVEEINTMIFAGHDTTATGVHFFLFCMASNPEIQKKCQTEVNMLFEDPQNFKNGAVTFEAASSCLKLVERCILETLRLFPSALALFRTLHTPLKTSYDGKDVLLPIGTNVVVAPYLLHRKPEYFPDPEKFDPNRFLPEECVKRPSCTYIPFSVGSRSCLGLKFAMIEIKMIAAYSLRHFSITTKDKLEDIPLLAFVTLTPAKDFTFNFAKRDISSAA